MRNHVFIRTFSPRLHEYFTGLSQHPGLRTHPNQLLQSSRSTTLPLLRHRNRTVSFTSMCSATQPRFTLDFLNADSALEKLHPLSHDAYGSFTPTASARAALQHLANSRKSAPRSFNLTLRLRTKSVWPEDDDSPLSSGPPSPTISISHAMSPCFTPGGLALGATLSSTIIDGYHDHERMTSDELHPMLAKLERKSKFLSQQALCSTCNKRGSGYPKCGSCDAMWCSRDCRLAGGKRHPCSQKGAK